MASEGTFNELDSETSEAVAVGDHNVEDAIAFDELQKGEEAPTLEVETGCHISDDFVVEGPFLLEEVDLALQVACFFLLWRGDPGVEDGETVLVVRFLLGRDAEVGPEVAVVVSMGCIGPGSDANGANFAVFGPSGQGGSGDAILFDHESWWKVFV